MDSAQRTELRSRNHALRERVESMLAELERQREHIVEASACVTNLSAQAWSTDGLLRVTVNAAGIPTEVHLDPEAFVRTRPDRLGASMVEAAQAAARQVAQLAEDAIAPIHRIAEEMPELSDLVPGAPSLRDLMNLPLPQLDTSPTGLEVPEDEEDSWGGPILR